ncbi:hypothetical protein KCP69_13770 [Salmonella enterica subsp. enterica]|nr:hypothetical protein KCP69_13770 [Salmonella enterica subsp. enterica]
MSDYTDASGRKLCYNITRDGFAFLLSGLLRAKRAAQFKRGIHQCL